MYDGAGCKSDYNKQKSNHRYPDSSLTLISQGRPLKHIDQWPHQLLWLHGSGHSSRAIVSVYF